MLCLLQQEQSGLEENLSDAVVDQLSDNMMLINVYWFEFQNLRKQSLGKSEFVESTIQHIMALLIPYLTDQQRQFMVECNELYWRNKQS